MRSCVKGRKEQLWSGITKSGISWRKRSKKECSFRAFKGVMQVTGYPGIENSSIKQFLLIQFRDREISG